MNSLRFTQYLMMMMMYTKRKEKKKLGSAVLWLLAFPGPESNPNSPSIALRQEIYII